MKTPLMKTYSVKEDTPDVLDQEETESRMQLCTVLSLLCKSAFLSFGCAWVLFLILFGTGKLFGQTKAADAAVTFRDPTI
jgi:hypothetical protein